MLAPRAGAPWVRRFCLWKGPPSMHPTRGLKGALGALTDRVVRGGGPDHHPAGSRGRPAATLANQRDELARVLYLSEQGFWGSGPAGGTPRGTAWGTSSERYLRERYLDRADAILAAGFRKHAPVTPEPVEVAQHSAARSIPASDAAAPGSAAHVQADEPACTPVPTALLLPPAPTLRNSRCCCAGSCRRRSTTV